MINIMNYYQKMVYDNYNYMMKSATMFYTESGKDIAKLQTEAYTHCMMGPTALVLHS